MGTVRGAPERQGKPTVERVIRMEGEEVVGEPTGVVRKGINYCKLVFTTQTWYPKLKEIVCRAPDGGTWMWMSETSASPL